MKRSTNVIVSNLSGHKILLWTFYTGPFLLFGKKTGGHGAPPPGLSPCYGTGKSCNKYLYSLNDGCLTQVGPDTQMDPSTFLDRNVYPLWLSSNVLIVFFSMPQIIKQHGNHLKASTAIMRLRLYSVLALLPPKCYEGNRASLHKCYRNNLIKVPMKWKTNWAQMKSLSKWRKMVFSFVWYLFSFQRYKRFCIMQIR